MSTFVKRERGSEKKENTTTLFDALGMGQSPVKPAYSQLSRQFVNVTALNLLEGSQPILSCHLKAEEYAQERPHFSSLFPLDKENPSFDI